MCVFKHFKFYFMHMYNKDIHFHRGFMYVDYCMIVEQLMAILLKIFLLPRDNIDA